MIEAILILGPSGSGKTPLGEMLARRGLGGRRCLHFDFGAELRRLAARDADGGELSVEETAFVRRVLQEGALLEDRHFSIAQRVLSGFLAQRSAAPPGDLVILNGLPRHIGQARGIEGLLAVRGVVVLECPPDQLRLRIRADTGGDRAGRVDDTPALAAKKAQLFRERTAPLIEYYERSGARIARMQVDAGTTAADIYASLTAALEQRPS